MKGITMKKTLLFVALTFLSASAFASKARVTALGGSMTKADDVQDAFMNPAKIFGFGDMLTIEFDTAASDTAEGGVFRSNGDAKYGVYFGHRSTGFARLVGIANAAPFNLGLLTEQNPFEIFYGQKGGDMRWAASFIYSSGEDKDANLKANTMGVRVGAATDVWEAYASIGLSGKSENSTANTSATNDLGLLVGGQYASGDVLYYGSYDSASGKVTQAATDTKGSRNIITLGAESKMKGDASHFFYGVKYQMQNDKAGDQKDDTSKLPVYAGVEADAASWLVLRASVAQSLLVNTRKVDPGTGAPATTDHTGLNDTVAAAGAGLKFGKLWIDGTLSAATNGGALNSTDTMANAALNYTW